MDAPAKADNGSVAPKFPSENYSKPGVKIIGEIGINHNGSVQLAKELISICHSAGCNYVKFQKRNPDVCVPEAQKTVMRKTPWGEMTYLDYKWKMEFQEEQFDEIYTFCKGLGVECFASVWDKDSCDFMAKYSDIAKIPSALITELDLCSYARSKFKYLIISTGMSTEEEIDACVDACKPDCIMHTNSTYPCPVGELNLNYIYRLKAKYPEAEIGYSGHEYGLVTTFATIPMGCSWVERHVTLNREMWGSDQKASIEPSGVFKLCKGIRDIEQALGEKGQKKRMVTDGELPKRKSLRGV